MTLAGMEISWKPVKKTQVVDGTWSHKSESLRLSGRDADAGYNMISNTGSEGYVVGEVWRTFSDRTFSRWKMRSSEEGAGQRVWWSCAVVGVHPFHHPLEVFLAFCLVLSFSRAIRRSNRSGAGAECWKSREDSSDLLAPADR